MKTLLYKDFVSLWKNLKNYLLMCVVFQLASLGGEDFEFMRYYPLILVASLPHTLLAYDERSGWEKYALTLPVSRKKLVGEKYLMGVILLGASFILAAATSLVKCWKDGYFDPFGYCFELSVLLTLGTSVMGVALPMTFKLGTEKGRMANMICYGILGGALVIFVMLGDRFGLSDISLNEWVIIPFLVIPLVVLPVSWLLSVRWYEKREF